MIDLTNDKAVILPESINYADFAGRENIVVISPHPDDDAIAAGGAIRLHADHNEPVFTIYLTTGANTPAAGRRSTATITSQRQEESVMAMKILGTSAGFFLHYESGEIIKTTIEDVAQDIFAILMVVKPKRIYLPSPFESHLTHLAATSRTLEALRRVPDLTPEMRGYSVWSEIFATPDELETIDISEVIDAKKRAMRTHESEIKFKPYDTATIGKNHFDAIFNDPHADSKTQYSETFLKMDGLALRPELELDVYARNLALKKLHDMYAEILATQQANQNQL